MFYPLVSVIIPVYQAEKFLTECVESVRKQDYSELEIVLVNDGSTDRSNQMCEELAAADPRIRVIHQNNKGSGAARNAGIKENGWELYQGIAAMLLIGVIGIKIGSDRFQRYNIE